MINFNYTILIQFFNFFILLILLNFILFKPVLKALKKRGSTIKQLADSAQTADTDVKTLGKLYEDMTKEKRKPILEGRDLAISEANVTSVRIIEKARAELSEELSRIRAEVGSESKKAFEALEGEVDKLSTEAAEKILRRSL